MNKRNLIGFTLFVGALALMLWRVFSPTDQIREPIAEQGQEQPDFYFKGAVASQFDKHGRLKTTATTPLLTRFDAKKTFHYQTPEIRVFSAEGSPWLINAEHGHAEDNGDIIHLNGTVTIKRKASENNRPIDVDTKNLSIYPKQNLAKTAEHTKIRSGKTTITGTGAVLNDANQTLSLLGDVKTYYDPTTR